MLNLDIAKNFNFQSTISNSLKTPWFESMVSTQKPTVIFFHGFPDGPEIFTQLAMNLQNDYNVILPFARGVGASEPASGRSRYSSQSMLLDNMKILDSLPIDEESPIFCIGHDLGGIHAIKFAEHMGERCSGVVLMSTLSLRQMWKQIRKPSQLMKSWYIGMMQLPLVPNIVAKKIPSLIHLYADKLGKDRNWNPAYESNYIENSVNQYKEFLKEAYKDRKSKKVQLSCPVLALWGNQDPFLDVPNRKDYDSLSHDVTMRIFKGGHWFFNSMPGETSNILKEFIQKNVEGEHDK